MVDNSPVWVEVDCVGEETGAKYFGRFEVKRYLTQKEKGDVGRLYETYSRGLVDDVGQKSMFYMLAKLSFHVLQSDAPWWKEKGLDLVDDEPAIALMTAIRNVQGGKKTEEEKKAV